MRKNGTLQGYPGKLLVVECDECPRISRHTKAALIERFGPDAKIPEVLTALCRPRRRGEPEHHPKLLGEHNELS